MITVEQHLAHILGGARPLPSESVPIAAAGGRVLAAPFHALHPVPPFTNSSMDGYAVRVADARPGVWLPVAGDVPAGPVEPAPLAPGTAQRIMTGAPLPPGADAIVPVEDTDQPRGPVPLPGRVRIDAAPTAGRFIRRAGEDVARGQEVLPAGSTLGPAALAAAISVGHAHAEVVRRPRVSVLSTGAELRAAGEPLAPGQIPDSNGPLLAALLTDAGAEVAGTAITDDDPARFLAAFRACVDADVVVTSGGASAGAFDVVKEVTAPLGVQFVEVAMQPGKPQGFGRLPGPGGADVAVLALPGNPVSVFVSHHLFLRPLLAALQGTTAEPTVVLARATTGWSCPPRRRQYTPVAVAFGDEVTCTPSHRLGSGSHLVASLHRADGLAVAGEDAQAVEAGEIVPVILVR